MSHKIGFLLAIAASILSVATGIEKKEIKVKQSFYVATSR